MTSAAPTADLKHTRRRRNDAGNIDRLPPHSIEAEQGVLGCVLLDPTQGIPALVEKLTAGEQTFYDLRHQTVYTALVAMFESGKPVDIITLQQYLKDNGLLDEVGGISYLNSLQDA